MHIVSPFPSELFLCLTEPSLTTILTLIQLITHPRGLSQTLHHVVAIMAREVGVL